MSPATELIIQRVGWVLAHFVWQAFAIAIALKLFLVLLRKSSADARYLTACFALGLLAAAPFLTYALNEHRGAAVQMRDVFTRTERDAFQTDGLPQRGILNALSSTALSTLNAISEPIIAIWIIGILLFLFAQIASYQINKRFWAGEPLSDELVSAVSNVASELRVDRVHYVVSPEMDSPATIGWLRPLVIIPQSLLNADPLSLRALVAHELAHVKRRDYIVNFLQTILTNILFFHPSVWSVSNAVRHEREHCCDDITASLVGEDAYSRALLLVEEARHVPREILAASGGSLLDRVKRLLSKERRPSASAGWASVAASGLVLLAVTGLLAKAANSDEVWWTANASLPVQIVIFSLLDANTNSTEFLPVLEETVKTPKPSAAQLDALANSFVGGAKPDALLQLATPLMDPSSIFAFEKSPVWRYGNSTQTLQLIMRLKIRSQSLSSSDPHKAMLLARASLFLAGEEDMIKGNSLMSTLIFEKDFAKIAALDETQVRRLKQAVAADMNVQVARSKLYFGAEQSILSAQKASSTYVPPLIVNDLVELEGMSPNRAYIELKIAHIIWMLKSVDPALAKTAANKLSTVHDEQLERWISAALQSDLRKTVP